MNNYSIQIMNCTEIPFLIHGFILQYAFVVCVCVRERERERDMSISVCLTLVYHGGIKSVEGTSFLYLDCFFKENILP